MSIVPHHPEGPGSFSDEELDATRMEGDPYADDLAEKIFGNSSMNAEPGSRLGYNKLVDIADMLDTDSELLLLEKSNFNKALKEFPLEFQDYYDPMPSPDWVDVTKIEKAQELWKEQSILMLGVLYAASLPACYLMKKGIPALYKTAKLKDSKYIFQRIYETGLMLDAVMSPDGLNLVHDVMPDSDDVFLKTLQDSAGGEWEKRGDEFVKTSGKESGEDVKEHTENAKKSFRVASGQRSYLWGRGYITAKKVRMLHASMRYMLLNPGVMMPRGKGSEAMADKFAKAHGTEAWPSEELGVPVNQEDLAFTLLTFAYLIPRGLEMIGVRVSLEEKEAFLHLWKVVGHVMGLRDDLLTDDWEEAEKLYNRIHKLQAGRSKVGIELTEAVMGFLKSYLPNAFGISKRIPVALIGAQMGDDAELLLSEENIKILRSPRTRFSMALIRGSLRLFNRRYQRLLDYIPISRRIFADNFFTASKLVVESWRDEYTRRPFYVPTSVNTWKLQKGVTDEFREELQDWRQHLFLALGSSMVALGVLFLGITLGLIFWAFQMPVAVMWALGTAVVGLVYSVFEIDVRIPKIFKNRPKPAGISKHSE